MSRLLEGVKVVDLTHILAGPYCTYQLDLLGPVFALQYISEMPIALRGNRSFSGSPFSGLYQAAEGSLVVVANTPRQTEALLRALGLDALREDPRVQDWRNHPEIEELLGDQMQQAFLARTSDAWEELLANAHVPAGKVRSLPEMLEQPYTAERGFRHEVFVPGLGETFPLPGVGFLAQGSNGYADSPPPELGEHSVEALREIGVEDAEIQRLLAAGVIKAAGDAAKSHSVA